MRALSEVNVSNHESYLDVSNHESLSLGVRGKRVVLIILSDILAISFLFHAPEHFYMQFFLKIWNWLQIESKQYFKYKILSNVYTSLGAYTKQANLDVTGLKTANQNF